VPREQFKHSAQLPCFWRLLGTILSERFRRALYFAIRPDASIAWRPCYLTPYLVKLSKRNTAHCRQVVASPLC
jgi:hypothetical protein